MAASQNKLNKAVLLHQQGQLAQAKAVYEEMLVVDPQHVDALHLLGVIAISEKNYQRAIELIDKAIAIDTQQAMFYCNRALALQAVKHFEEAVESYDRAIALKPDFAAAFNNRGSVRQALKQLEAAIKDYDRAIAIQPAFAEAHFNRGNIMLELKLFEAAIDAYDQALAIKPDYVIACVNRGRALLELKRWEAAIESYDRAIALKPDYADVYYNKALVLLSRGDFENGWELYEWRSKITTKIFHPINITNHWDGKKIAGALLVLSEQGLGDVIFYSGMLNDLYGLANKITVCVESRLLSLYQRSFEQIEFISTASPPLMQSYDAQIYMGSLGRYFRASEQALRDHVKTPYLQANVAAAQYLRKRLFSNKKLICGLSWISKNADFGDEKTLRLIDLKSIFELADIDFVDLQYGNTDEEQAALFSETGIKLTRIHDVDNFQDIEGWAALIEACDIVLTISNTTAHAACALGKPTIIMLPHVRGLLWYWHEERDRCSWYPTAKLIRQQKDGEWGSVIEEVKRTLAAEIFNINKRRDG